MSHTLDGVFLAMGPVICGVNAPVVPGPVMSGSLDAIHHRISHDDVRRLHVDPCPQRFLPIRKFSGFHAHEQVEVLFNRAITMWTVAAHLSESAAVFLHLITGEITHVGISLLDQLSRPVIQLTEVITGEAKFIPFEPEPADVLLDRIDVALLLSGWVGVIETEIASALILLSESEVQTDRLGVTDMKKTIRLWRKTQLDLAVIDTRLEIQIDHFFDEIGGTVRIFTLVRIHPTHPRLLLAIQGLLYRNDTTEGS